MAGRERSDRVNKIDAAFQCSRPSNVFQRGELAIWRQRITMGYCLDASLLLKRLDEAAMFAALLALVCSSSIASIAMYARPYLSPSWVSWRDE